MKNLKHFVFLPLIFLIAYFTYAQPALQKAAREKKHLINLYHQWNEPYGRDNNFSQPKSNARIESSSFYPLKAANYTWNTGNSIWDIFDTTLYTYAGPDLVSAITRKDSANNFLTRVLKFYDGANNLIDVVNQNWSSGWVNNNRDTFAFDVYGNTIMHQHQTWGGTQWTTAGGDNYINTYSGTGKILVQTAQTWNAAVWQNNARFTSTYNGTDQITQTIRESWNTVSLVWVNTSKTDYSYDASNVNDTTIDYSWNVTVWKNNSRIINLVWSLWTGEIATSKPQSYLYQTWSGSAWVNDERLQNAVYTVFGGRDETFQLYISSSWVNEYHYLIFYDMQYNYTGERYETWNVPLTVWDTTYEYKYLFTYDVNNSITQSIYQEFDGSLHTYVNHFKTVYSDFLFLNVYEINEPEIFSAVIYPNPMTDYADVIISSEIFSPVLFQIYDLKGRLILSEQPANKNFRLHKNNFTPGIYLLLISCASGEVSSLKFAVQ